MHTSHFEGTVQPPRDALRLHADMQTERDPVESGPNKHTGGRYGITGVHTGRSFVGERACYAPHHDQSIPCHHAARAVLAHGPSRARDVGGHRMRRRTNLENPSTSVDAESPPLHGQGGRWTSIGDARAASGLQKSGSHPPPRPRRFLVYCTAKQLHSWRDSCFTVRSFSFFFKSISFIITIQAALLTMLGRFSTNLYSF